jgi:hypothetical protein
MYQILLCFASVLQSYMEFSDFCQINVEIVGFTSPML